ncbi:Mss4-like protein [Mycena alexandri]|uniref:Mss4-like protein n=1 Tax=Mycena alexandri TaxID=1745969 RepID=A0AAD6T1C8_9AGAR|nr:Mss4-like protein [Mycena alexandri]
MSAGGSQNSGSSSVFAGNCHCGAFKFTVKLTNLNHISSCNCSLCSRNAYLWAHPASNSDLTVLLGEGSLKSYQYGTSVHKFCPVCGTSILCKTDKEISVNVRSLTDVDVESLSAVVTPCGITVEPSQLQFAMDSPPGDLHATCHCGGITYTLHMTPAATKSCNCSICSRNGVLWAYPLTKDVTVRAQTSLVEYTFGRKQIVHGFCGTCSVPVWEYFLNPAKAHTMGINVRAIADFEFARLPTRVHNGKATPPQYQA